jgi:hypothetical protein
MLVLLLLSVVYANFIGQYSIAQMIHNANSQKRGELGNDNNNHNNNHNDNNNHNSNSSHDKPLPLFTPFYWNATPHVINNTVYWTQTPKYSINGTFCIDIPGANALCTPTSLVVDPQGNRMSYDQTASGGGMNPVMGNNSYFFAQNGLGNSCLVVNGWSFTSQIKGYLSVSSETGSTTRKARYVGLARDIGGCQYDLGVSIITTNGFITQFDFSQRYPVPAGPNGTLICYTVIASLIYDINTLTTGGNYDSWFNIPNSCSPGNGLDFCSTIYPPHSVCYPTCV